MPLPPPDRPRFTRAAPPAAAAASPDGLERLNKRMAALGLCSRREADLWIDQGWVKVNGQVAEMGVKVTAADKVEVPDAPDVSALHAEYVEKGGRFFACPICVKTRKMEDATWTKNAEVKGAPAMYEFAAGGALTFNY